MIKIELTLSNLLAHLQLGKKEDLTTVNIARLIVEETIFASGSEVFIIKEIKFPHPDYIKFLGNTCEHCLYYDEPDGSFLILKN